MMAAPDFGSEPGDFRVIFSGLPGIHLNHFLTALNLNDGHFSVVNQSGDDDLPFRSYSSIALRVVQKSATKTIIVSREPFRKIPDLSDIWVSRPRVDLRLKI